MTGPEGGGAEGAAHRFQHSPVMLAEILELLEPVPPGLVVDATVGGAGHAAGILRAFDRLALLGIDQDAEAVAAASARLAPFGRRAQVRRARFDDLATVVEEQGPAFAEVIGGTGARGVVAVLFDLGVSSHQLDRPERGFSYRRAGPLDMRMDTDRPLSAAQVVNGADEGVLARLFAEGGEQRFARRIARAVVAARPIESTTALADVVSSAVPMAARRRGHPARRVFQALRVAVNEELDILPGALDDAIGLLAPQGRCLVLAYHSGEDRIVKERFREAATGGCHCPPSLPCACGAVPLVALLTRGARRPGAPEVAANPRAEAARLRVAVRLDAGGNR